MQVYERLALRERGIVRPCTHMAHGIRKQKVCNAQAYGLRTTLNSVKASTGIRTRNKIHSSFAHRVRFSSHMLTLQIRIRHVCSAPQGTHHKRHTTRHVDDDDVRVNSDDSESVKTHQVRGAAPANTMKITWFASCSTVAAIPCSDASSPCLFSSSRSDMITDGFCSCSAPCAPMSADRPPTSALCVCARTAFSSTGRRQAMMRSRASEPRRYFVSGKPLVWPKFCKIAAHYLLNRNVHVRTHIASSASALQSTNELKAVARLRAAEDASEQVGAFAMSGTTATSLRARDAVRVLQVDNSGPHRR